MITGRRMRAIPKKGCRSGAIFCEGRSDTSSRGGVWNSYAVPIAALLLAAGCTGRHALPDADTPAYREVVADFYGAVARIQTGSEQGAIERLRRAAEIAPGEAAIWYNMAVLSLRRGDAEGAATFAERARDLDSDNSTILLLSGLIELQREKSETALSFLREAVRADSGNVRAMYLLAREAKTVDATAVGEDADQLMDRILRLKPDNTAAILQAMRMSAEDGDDERVARLMASLETVTSDWPADVRDQVDALRTALQVREPLPAVVAAILRVGNIMKQVDAHRAYLQEVDFDLQDPQLVMTRFLELPSPSGRPSPADQELTFERQPLMPEGTTWSWTGTVFLSDGGPLAAVAVSGDLIRVDPNAELAFPASATSKAIPEHPIAFLDYNYDFRMDLVAAGPLGIRIYRQEPDGTFKDRTGDAGVAATAASTAYSGVWALDIDLEGDMDLVVSMRDGPMRLFRNNGDGTFAPPQPVLTETSRVRDMTWADLDDDGDPDAVLLDRAGELHLHRNDRSGLFTHEQLAAPSPTVAIHVADIDGDGFFEVVTLQADGSVAAVSWPADHPTIATVLAATKLRPSAKGFARVATADVDNNGALDVIASAGDTSAVWLRDADLEFRQLLVYENLRIFDEADLGTNGNLHLVAIDANGAAIDLVNRSQKGYLSRSILPKAADTAGDRRINSFGVGGEIELRADLLYQKRPITGPIVHFGLGDRQLVDVARIDWPNGTSQAQFDLASDQALIATQSLKGSCPWVFTFDGSKMRFVTDFLWRSPLGLRINAVETAGIATTEDWIKIDGKELAPRDNVYDLRITAELWETHFFDLIRMDAIDHPEDTDIFVDEVFIFPPNELTVHVTDIPREVGGAWDDGGRDVSDIVREEDGVYVDGFQLYSHQGRAAEHYVEVDLPDVPVDVPVWLIASGWIRPTDSSINVALGQGHHPPPHGVRLDVRDDSGEWTTVYSDLGFPAGKSKTMLIDLTNVFGGLSSRRLRLVTNLEIYWDALSWAEARDAGLARKTSLSMLTADLTYRGFSYVAPAKRSSPEIPAYDSVASTAPRWRDLEGFHTRFGDVAPLLASVDDRYVIMNAGDELSLTFAALPPPENGWKRDFVLAGDGWVKDGDYNTTFSRTVLPLPKHGVDTYDEPLLKLVDNPAYVKHQEDWVRFHTRYVSPRNYRSSLRSASR